MSRALRMERPYVMRGAPGGFRVLKKTQEAPYTTKVNYCDPTSRGPTPGLNLPLALSLPLSHALNSLLWAIPHSPHYLLLTVVDGPPRPHLARPLRASRGARQRRGGPLGHSDESRGCCFSRPLFGRAVRSTSRKTIRFHSLYSTHPPWSPLLSCWVTLSGIVSASLTRKEIKSPHEYPKRAWWPHAVLPSAEAQYSSTGELLSPDLGGSRGSPWSGVALTTVNRVELGF